MTEKSPLVVSFDTLGRDDVPRVGGKNASLGEMVRHLGRRGVTIPPGYATTAETYWHFVDANQLRDTIAAAFQDLKEGKAPLSETGQTIRRAFLRGEWPEDAAEAIRNDVCTTAVGAHSRT